MAANLNVSVQAGGSNEITVPPGAVVQYEVIGVLSDDLTQGLALVGFDLTYDCGDLPQADTPTTPPMNNFVYEEGVTTAGLNNPQGYKGTKLPDENNTLRQVGGAQNTIKNTAENAPFPTGTPMLNIAQPGSPVVLVTGSFTAPEIAIECHLNLFNLFANVITGDTTCEPFCKTEQAGVGNISNLTIFVVPGGDADLVSSSPACGQSLWRTRGNFILLSFDGPVELPAAGQIQVRELLDSGMYSTTDLASNFTMALEAGGTRLRLQEGTTSDSALINRRWYGITENGWSGVNGFKVDVLVQRGDVNLENRVSSADASAINNALCAQLGCGDDRREDINGDRRISSADRSIVNGFLTGGAVIPQKPGGHACNP